MQHYRRDRQSFEGFETWHNSLRMKYKMHTRIFLVFIIFIIAMWIINISITKSLKTDIAAKWLIAKCINKIKPSASIVIETEKGKKQRATVRAISNTEWLKNVSMVEIKRLSLNLLKFSSILLFYPFVLLKFKNISNKQSGKKYIRGSKFDSKQEYKKKAKKRKEKLDIPFGEIYQPTSAENTHTYIVGQPGSGKTVCINRILKRVIEREEKGIVYDYKGDYTQKFYDPEKDLLFNPLDKRSLGWDLFNDIETKMDIDTRAAILIPEDKHENPFWAIGARSVFSGIMHGLYQTGQRTNKALWDKIVEDAPKLVNMLNLTDGGQAGHRFLGDGDSNQSLGVLAKLMQHTSCLQYMKDISGNFKVKEWLNNGKPGMIYVNNTELHKETLKPILTLFIVTVGQHLLSLNDNIKRRVFFFFDEINTLQKIETMVDLLTGSRSKGGSFYIGFQDYGKIDSIYTPEIRKSIINACSSSVIFRLSDDDAKIASKNMGELQYIETNRTYSMGPHDYRDGISISEKKEKEYLMLPSEIEALKNMEGIVKFPNHNRVKTTWYDPKMPSKPKYIYPDKNITFEVRKELLLEEIAKKQKEIFESLDSLDIDIPIEKA